MPKGKTNKRYTGALKQKVTEMMLKENLSYRKTARQFKISENKMA